MKEKIYCPFCKRSLTDIDLAFGMCFICTTRLPKEIMEKYSVISTETIRETSKTLEEEDE